MSLEKDTDNSMDIASMQRENLKENGKKKSTSAYDQEAADETF